MIVTIDGPVAAGKTTAARALASRLGFTLLDTGAVYRCLALACRRRQCDWTDEQRAVRLAGDLEIRFRTGHGHNRVFLDREDVSNAIRDPEISQGASIVSALPGVRAALLQMQRGIARGRDVVAEGRDTGTVVFPNAEVKFFLTAAPEIRAQRRHLELINGGTRVSARRVLSELQQRDERDRSRAVAPLKRAADAVLIDSSKIEVEDVLTEMLQHPNLFHRATA